MLSKPAEVKFRFDVSALEDIVREETGIQPENPTFKYEFTEVTNQLAIYAWQANVARGSQSESATEEANVNLSAWRRLPSKINYTPEGDFLLENYVTPVQMENASQQKLETDAIDRQPKPHASRHLDYHFS